MWPTSRRASATGGAPDSYLLHLAISVGPADWLEPVTDDEYEEVVRVLA